MNETLFIGFTIMLVIIFGLTIYHTLKSIKTEEYDMRVTLFVVIGILVICAIMVNIILWGAVLLYS